jgi:hypothetical protein
MDEQYSPFMQEGVVIDEDKQIRYPYALEENKRIKPQPPVIPGKNRDYNGVGGIHDVA